MNESHESAPAGAPAAAPYVSDTTGMTPTQAEAMRFVDAHRAELLRGTSNATLLAQNREALSHALADGPVPDFIARASGQDTTRPADSQRDAFEAAAAPATEQQRDALVDRAVLLGVARPLAQEAGRIAGELGLSEGHTKTLLDRVQRHHGADFDGAAEGSLRVLSREDEIAEYHAEASRSFGSTEKFAEVSARAREFLAARGVLEKFDKAGLTGSTLAYDPRVLIALCAAADAAGVPRGGK